MKAVVAVAQFAATWWSLSSAVLFWVKFFGGDVRHRYLIGFRWVWAELRPLYLPAVAIVIGNLVLKGEMLGWNTFNAAMALVSWWLYKDIDEDDRWKRRKAKLVEKVARKGARLVVVPVAGGGR